MEVQSLIQAYNVYLFSFDIWKINQHTNQLKMDPLVFSDKLSDSCCFDPQTQSPSYLLKDPQDSTFCNLSLLSNSQTPNIHLQMTQPKMLDQSSCAADEPSSHSLKIKGSCIFTLLQKRRSKQEPSTDVKSAFLRWHLQIKRKEVISGVIHHMILESRITPHVFFYRLFKQQRAQNNSLLLGQCDGGCEANRKAFRKLDKQNHSDKTNKIEQQTTKKRKPNNSLGSIMSVKVQGQRNRQKIITKLCKQIKTKSTIKAFQKIYLFALTSHILNQKTEKSITSKQEDRFISTVTTPLPNPNSLNSVIEQDPLELTDQIQTLRRYIELVNTVELGLNDSNLLRLKLKESQDRHLETLHFFKSLKLENTRISTILLVSRIKNLFKKRVAVFFS